MTTAARPFALLLAAPGLDLAPLIDAERVALLAAGIDAIIPHDDAERDRLLPDAALLLVFGAHVHAAMIQRLRHCRGIVSFSTGLDHVDVPAAEAAGIPVRNVPDYSTEEVAEHALTLLLACARKLVPLHLATRAGDWGWRPIAGEMHTVAGRTLGVVGLGRIGRLLAAKARGIGLLTIAFDPFLGVGSATADCPLISLDALLATSDFVSVHVPLSPATHHLVNAEALARMRPSAFLVNTARGGLVDEAALLEALRAGGIAGAALDVREHEPPPVPDPLAELPNVILTPHVAAFSLEAADRLHEYGSRIAVELYRARPTPDAAGSKGPSASR